MRIIGYIRVSQVRGREGDSFISPDVQRERISNLAAAQGHVVVEWIEDLDQSGAKVDRPGFQRAIEMVEQGEADGVAVARLDRFARSTIDTEMSVRRLEQAGGAFIAADIGLDTSTPVGKLVRTFLAAIAEFELDRIRENWRVSTERHIRRGAHHGRAPIGYRKRDDGSLEPDENAGEVRTMFRMRAEGASWLQIRQATGDKWSRGTIVGIVTNPTYLGFVRAGEFVSEVPHEPLVDRATWEQAQTDMPMSAPRKKGSLLAGLLRCEACGYRMSVERDGTRGYANYSCRKHHSGTTCPNPSKISMLRADGYVTDQFLAWAEGLVVSGQARSDRIDAAAAALDVAEGELAAYRDADVVDIIGAQSFREGLSKRAAKVDDARARLVDERRHADVAQLGSLVAMRDEWERMSVDDRRALLVATIDQVVVKRAHLRGRAPADGRLRIVWQGGPANDSPEEVGALLALDRE